MSNPREINDLQRHVAEEETFILVFYNN